MKNLVTAFLLGFAAIITGCSSSTQPVTTTSTPWGPNTQTYQVKYGENVVLIDSLHLDVIHSADTVDSGDPDVTPIDYHLDAASSIAQNLQPDQILLIHGQSIRKVDAVDDVANGEIVVHTSDATLADAIESGTIAWDYGLQYDANLVHPSIIMPKTGKHIPMERVSGNTFKVSFPLGDYKGTIEMTLNGTNAATSIILEKSLGTGLSAKLTCTGTIERFRQKSDMNYASHTLQTFHHVDQGVKGDLTLNATLAASGSDLLGGIDLPVVLLDAPYLVGPLLVQLKVSAKFVVNTVVPVEGSAQLETHFSYNSDLGFKYEGTDVSASGQIGDWKMEKNKAEIGAQTAVGVNFGIDFPKVSVDLMHKSLVLYAQTGILTSGDFTFNPACLRAQGVYLGSVGYNLGILGLVDIAKGSAILWNEQKTFIQSGNCK